MLGTVIGDLAGSVPGTHEPPGRRLVPPFPPNAHFTHHTVCTVGAADALLSGADPARALRHWCRRHERESRRSPALHHWVNAADPRPCGSHDPGGAARVSPAGLLGRSIEDTLGRALRVTAITHDHPEGIRSALAVAAAIRWAREGLAADALRARLTEHFAYDLTPRAEPPGPAPARPPGIGAAAQQAIACALDARGFEDAVGAAVAIGHGDAALAAIAGGIAEARFGIPPDLARAAWSHLPPELADVLVRLYDAADCPRPGG